ncbi:MAG: hypothetical protein IT365_00645 [Candidatus Hydrogenedentes bacterium]|nr:hypothetical protein [Candidatus Hydrogenedentota bacterium]
MNGLLPRKEAIRALLWEDWRRCRWAFLGILALGAALSLTGFAVTTYWWLKGHHDVELDEEVYALAVWPVFFFALWLVFSLSDPKDVTPRIPARHYALPVSPRKVALVHLLFRLALIGVLMALLSALVQMAMLTFVPVQILGTAAGAMAGFLVLQCLAWTFGNFGGIPFFVSLVMLPIVLSVSNAEEKLGSVIQATDALGVPRLFLLLIALLGIGWLAIEGARMGRHVDPSLPLLWRIGFLRLGWRPRDGKVSPLKAQVNYEWKRKGRLLPVLTLSFVAVAVFFFVTYADTSVPRNRLGALGLSMMLFPVYAAPIAAILAGVLGPLDDYRQRISGVGLFLFTRAADNGLHSRARLIMSLKSVSVTMGSCLLIMCGGVVLTTIARPETLLHYYANLSWTWLPGAVMIAASYVLMVWTLYWMAIPGAILWFWLVLVTISNELIDGGTHPFFAFMLVWPPSLAMIAATIYVVRRNAQAETPFPWASRLAIYTSVAALCVIAWVGDFNSIWDSTVAQFGMLTVLPAILALALCPAFPILAQPMLVERLRRG